MVKSALVVGVLFIVISLFSSSREESTRSLEDHGGIVRSGSAVVYPERRYANVIHIFPPKRRRRRPRCLRRRRRRPYYDRMDTVDPKWGQDHFASHYTIVPLVESAKSIGDGRNFIPIAILRHGHAVKTPHYYVNVKNKGGKSTNPQFSYNVKFEEFPTFQQNTWDSIKVSRDQEEILKKVKKYAQPGRKDHFRAQEPIPGQILYPPVSPRFLPVPLFTPPRSTMITDIPLGGFRGTNQDRWSRGQPSSVDRPVRVKDFYERDIPRTPSIMESNASRGIFYEDQIHKNHRHYLARNSTVKSGDEMVKPVYEDVDEGVNTSSYRPAPFIASKANIFVTPRSPNATDAITLSTLLINHHSPARNKSVKVVKMSGFMAGFNYSKSHPVYNVTGMKKNKGTLGQKVIPTVKIPARWSPVSTSTTISPSVQQSDQYSTVDIKPNISMIVETARTSTENSKMILEHPL
ncbi:hypothetical protein DMENIID0001_162130 [Sergentomyia squamirostris]